MVVFSVCLANMGGFTAHHKLVLERLENEVGQVPGPVAGGALDRETHCVFHFFQLPGLCATPSGIRLVWVLSQMHDVPPGCRSGVTRWPQLKFNPAFPSWSSPAGFSHAAEWHMRNAAPGKPQLPGADGTAAGQPGPPGVLRELALRCAVPPAQARNRGGTPAARLHALQCPCAQLTARGCPRCSQALAQDNVTQELETALQTSDGVVQTQVKTRLLPPG